MANKTSADIGNRDATPAVLTTPGGALSRRNGSISITTSETSGQTMRYAQIPSNARNVTVRLWCGSSGTAGAVDIGIYRTTADGGAVVDVDFFASAQALTTALSGQDVTHESGEFSLVESEEPLWDALGVSADPNVMYDVVATITTAVQNTAATRLIVDYTV